MISGRSQKVHLEAMSSSNIKQHTPHLPHHFPFISHQRSRGMLFHYSPHWQHLHQ